MLFSEMLCNAKIKQFLYKEELKTLGDKRNTSSASCQDKACSLQFFTTKMYTSCWTNLLKCACRCIWTFAKLVGWKTFESPNGQWNWLQHLEHCIISGRESAFGIDFELNSNCNIHLGKNTQVICKLFRQPNRA